MKVLVVYYSMSGHTHCLADAVAEGAKEIEGAQVEIRRVPETLSKDELKKRKGSKGIIEEVVEVPFCTMKDLESADAIIFGTPSYLGNMCSQMCQFLDSTGDLWKRNALVGKVGSVFCSSGSQHGGQEATILSFHPSLLHLGMIIVGLPYTFEAQRRVDEVMGATPYGASTTTGKAGERWPSEVELEAAKFQGKHVASIAKKLSM